jgi:hypothetical protein
MQIMLVCHISAMATVHRSLLVVLRVLALRFLLPSAAVIKQKGRRMQGARIREFQSSLGFLFLFLFFFWQ